MEWSDDYKAACKLYYKKNQTDDKKQECLLLLTAEADRENVLALHDLGKAYASGTITEPNTALAKSYYAKALTRFQKLEDFAPKIKAYIQYRIGKMCAYDLGTEQDDAKAFAYFLQASDAGNRFAQYYLANMYYHGKGTAQNHAEAFKWYEKAAEKKVPHAASALARMYEMGDDNLLYNVGRMFQKGLGTSIDIRNALNLFKRSATHRNKWAEFQLGCIYLFGADGIKSDREQAVEWLTHSAEHGNEYAAELLQKIELFDQDMMQDTILGLFMDVSRILREAYERSERKLQSQIDSKLRKMIRKKKCELGIQENGQQLR
ncbi:MAG: sel1 repeat family protein, partial [Oscillospiraceae bacterium]|nr:sel1 repeat family protein [Oscillospiraceae bacterium]